MKMPKEQYEQLREYVRSLMTQANFDNANCSRERFRWNCMWSAVPSSFSASLYFDHHLKDDHIDTALKKIMDEQVA